MPLDFQVQQYPFRVGLAEGTDPHQVPPGTLTTLENGSWKQSGRIEKRFGTEQLQSTILGGGNIAAGSRLFARGSELCLIDGTSLYAYSSTLTTWKNIGRVPNLGITSTALLDSYRGVSATDIALSSSGLLVHAWLAGDPTATTGGALFAQVVDQATGAVMLAPTLVSSTTHTRLRVVVIGSTAILVALAGANVTAFTIDLATMAVSAGTNLRTDAAGAAMDACVIGSNFVVLYSKAASVDLYSYNTSLVQQATAVVEAVVSGVAGGIDGAAGESLYVAYANGGSSPRFAVHTANTLAQTVAPATVEALAGGSNFQTTVCRFDASNCIIAYSVSSPSGGRVTTFKAANTGVIDTTSERGTWGSRMASRPFMVSGSCYVFAGDFPSGTTANTTFMGNNLSLLGVDVSTKGGASSYVPHRYVGLVEPIVGGQTTIGCLPNVVASTATKWLTSLPFLAEAPVKQDTWRCGARLVAVTTGASLPADTWRTVTVGQEAYIAGGILAAHDGARVFDYGYARAPIILSATGSGAGGVIAAGSYLYATLREYKSSAGILHRSPVATVAAVTLAGATSSVALTMYEVNLANKQDLTSGFGASVPLSERLPIYRTTVGGTTYQRLTYDPTFNLVTVSTTSQTQTVTDTRSDADITTGGSATVAPLAGRPALYTTGGILDDYAPPSNVTQFLHADRLWVLANDQKTWWYSKAFQDDLGVAPGFNPAFRIVFKDTQTAGASMDDKAIFFSATGASYMQGVGPGPNGQGSDFQVPMPIQSDVGCTNARSLVSTPDGIMFLSARGIYLLTRGLELVWLGRPVKDTLAAYPNVTSATLVAAHNEVRFTCTNAALTASVVLVYNYVEKQWSTSRYWVDGTYGGPIADACMWNGTWTIVSTLGTVYKETTASYMDATPTHYVPMTLETAWISAAGPMAFHSVRTFALHGQSHTAHDLTISVGFDSEPTFPQSGTWLAGTPVTDVGVEECSLTIGTRRKCNAIRFKIVDATPTSGTVGTGRGPAFDMMGIEVGVKRGFGNTPATKRA